MKENGKFPLIDLTNPQTRALLALAPRDDQQVKHNTPPPVNKDPDLDSSAEGPEEWIRRIASDPYEAVCL